MGVKGRERLRPEGFSEIPDIRHEGIAEARDQSETARIVRRTGSTLHEESHEAVGGDETEQRGFFPHERAPRPSGPAAQRPVVEQEKRARKRDEHRLGQESEDEAKRDQRVAGRGSSADVANVSAQAEQPEERSEDVLSLGDPCDGFNMQRMESEECGDQGRAPECARKHAPDKEDQCGVERMPEEIFPVHWRRIQAEDLTVQVMRERGERMPVVAVHGRERPDDRGRTHPLIYHRLEFDVGVVVEVDEAALSDGPIGGEGRHEQRAEDPPGRLGADCTGARQGPLAGRVSRRRRGIWAVRFHVLARVGIENVFSLHSLDKRIVVVMPAYNADRTPRPTCDEIMARGVVEHGACSPRPVVRRTGNGSSHLHPAVGRFQSSPS